MSRRYFDLIESEKRLFEVPFRSFRNNHFAAGRAVSIGSFSGEEVRARQESYLPGCACCQNALTSCEVVSRKYLHNALLISQSGETSLFACNPVITWRIRALGGDLTVWCPYGPQSLRDAVFTGHCRMVMSKCLLEDAIPRQQILSFYLNKGGLIGRIVLIISKAMSLVRMQKQLIIGKKFYRAYFQ